MKLADNEYRHKILDKFNFCRVSTIDMSYLPLRVSQTWKNVVRMIAISFLIKSSSDLVIKS